MLEHLALGMAAAKLLQAPEHRRHPRNRARMLAAAVGKYRFTHRPRHFPHHLR